jgi:hypothetical protein
MNKLHEILETQPSQTLEQFERSFRKVFGIPAETENYDGGVYFTSHGEKFSIDHEGTLLWYLNKKWRTITSLEQARTLWQS